MIKDFYRLTKPRMAYANAFVAAAAFVFASPETFDWRAFLLMLAGLALVIGGACVFNNVADRDMDARMERTKTRALAAGRIKPAYTLIYGAALLAAGCALLYGVDRLALLCALGGFAAYVFVYTPLKPRTSLALYPGAVAGAVPTLVGYAAAAHRLDGYAWAFFAFLFLWQIPHFLAIARFRYDEYATANVPLSVGRPQNEKERRRARLIFYASLVVLLAACGLLMLQRWMR
ncbi:MAG TPA: protoheme IX farnesyltransferase [Candidatus Paceibacterota bacterium]|nr:protoheme IX farnesyltransferase [Candidatus Paceibacterota bacterium]